MLRFLPQKKISWGIIVKPQRMKDTRLPGYSIIITNNIFDPEEIMAEIEIIGETDPDGAKLRKDLYNYRFYTRKENKKLIISDKLMTFWVELMFYEKTTDKSKFRMKMARKTLIDIIDSAELKSIFSTEWPNERILYEQLYAAARRYFFTCQTDRTYTSMMFGFVAIKRPQLIKIMIADYFDAALCFS